MHHNSCSQNDIFVSQKFFRAYGRAKGRVDQSKVVQKVLADLENYNNGHMTFGQFDIAQCFCSYYGMYLRITYYHMFCTHSPALSPSLPLTSQHLLHRGGKSTRSRMLSSLLLILFPAGLLAEPGDKCDAWQV